MKIFYDNVSAEYIYPISKKDCRKIKEYIPSDFKDKIKSLRFGCNSKTTQEGRTVKRGKFYDIRVNFCLKNLQSLVLSDSREYIEEVKEFGGKPNLATRIIDWDILNAKHYVCYILFHEIGHIIYCEKYLNGRLSEKTSKNEEQWCNKYSMQIIALMREGEPSVQ